MNLLKQTFNKTYAPLKSLQEVCDRENIPPLSWCVAGGAIRIYLEESPKQTDLDVFIFDRGTFYTLAKNISIQSRDDSLIKGRFSYAPNKWCKIDLIYVENGCLQSVLESFDFTVCCAAYFNKEYFSIKEWEDHCIDKKLVLNNVTRPKALLRRIQQYAVKGYFIDEQFTEEFLDYIQTTSDFDRGYAFSSGLSGYETGMKFEKVLAEFIPSNKPFLENGFYGQV